MNGSGLTLVKRYVNEPTDAALLNTVTAAIRSSRKASKLPSYSGRKENSN